MSSNAFAATLDIRPRPSRQLLFLIVLLHALAGIVVGYFLQPHWVAILLWLSLLASLAIQIRRHWRLSGNKVVKRAVWTTVGDWQLVCAGSELQPAELQSHSLVHPWLLILHFRFFAPGHRKRVVMVLPRDSLEQDMHRRLRARLRMTVVDTEEG